MTADFVSFLLTALIALFIVAAGQAVVMIGGGVDLAAPGLIAVTTATGSWVLSTTSGSVPAAATAMLAAGLALGALQGLGVAVLRLPAWVVSLASLGIWAGLATAAAVPIARGMAPLSGSLPAWTGVALLIGFAIHLALEKLVFGRWLRALGCHGESARTAGVPVVGVTVGAYALSGFCAGLAAIFLCAHPPADGAFPRSWWLVDILGSVVIAGVHGSSGRGSVGLVLLGALVMVLLGTGLAMVGTPDSAIAAVKSSLVLAILAIFHRPGAP